MIDWLSSKVAMGVVAVLIVSSAAGAFSIVKDRAVEQEMAKVLDELAGIMCAFAASGNGKLVISRGDLCFPNAIMGEEYVLQIYNGLAIATCGRISVSGTVPGAIIDGGGPLIPQTSIALEFSGGALHISVY